MEPLDYYETFLAAKTHPLIPRNCFVPKVVPPNDQLVNCWIWKHPLVENVEKHFVWVSFHHTFENMIISSRIRVKISHGTLKLQKKYCKLNFLPLDPKTMKKKIRPANMFFLHIGILVWFPLHTKIVRTLRGFLGYKVIHHNPNNLYTFTTSNLRWVQLRRNAHYARVLGHIGPIWATFKNHYNIPWC